MSFLASRRAPIRPHWAQNRLHCLPTQKRFVLLNTHTCALWHANCTPISLGLWYILCNSSTILALIILTHFWSLFLTNCRHWGSNSYSSSLLASSQHWMSNFCTKQIRWWQWKNSDQQTTAGASIMSIMPGKCSMSRRKVSALRSVPMHILSMYAFSYI